MSIADQYKGRYTGNLHPARPYTMGMVGYVIEEEMPVKLADVLSRRLRALRLDVSSRRGCKGRGERVRHEDGSRSRRLRGCFFVLWAKTPD